MAKTYREFCTVARALDVIGERWALLVVRELVLGPRRYTDLLEGLPGIGTNVLAARLRELEAAGVVERRRLPPPAPATVYELTERGRALGPVLVELARWGLRDLDEPRDDDAVESRWFVLGLAATIRPDASLAGTAYELHIGDEVYGLTADDGGFNASHGAPPQPTATLTMEPGMLFALAMGYITPDAVATKGHIGGDEDAAHRLLELISRAWAPALPK
ncbi:MAG: winged helix-turn-helix transcriptional regulator [Actinobacteria bacterium]|nr:winged helix-turn-helix transcriptional regulator [Actinomycetota bacterium]